MPTRKKSKAEIRAERVHHWEKQSGKNFEKIHRMMTSKIIRHVRNYKKHYGSEISKLRTDRSLFISRIKSSISMGLDFYISYEIGNIDKLDRSLHTQWSETIRILRKAEHYISQVSKSSIVSITTPSGRIEWQHVTRPVQESLDHAIAVSIDEKKLSELRGVKPSGAAVLTLELFDSLEWCFKRKIARNFDISRGKKKSETYIKEFLNPDVILIYVLVNVVENGVSVGHIRQALSRMPTAHQ